MENQKIELLKTTLEAINREDISLLSSLLAANECLVNGAPYGEKDESGYLDYAILGNSISVVKEFIAHGADVNRLNPAPLFTTPLCTAANEGNIDIVELLLNNGALVDGRDLTAITPLMIAAQQGHLDIVKVLVGHGSQLHRLGYIQRFFPVDFAQSYGHLDCVSYLRSCGGLSVTDEYNWENVTGYPIIAHVSRNGGPVYPIGFPRVISGTEFQFRLASIRAKDEPLFIFSAGLYLSGKPVEIGVALPNRWPLLKNYLCSDTYLSFPIDILAALAAHVSDGEDFKEGFLIEKDSIAYKNLEWPKDVVAMIAVNHAWGTNDIDLSNSLKTEDVVEIFTLVPILDGTKFTNSKSFIDKWCAAKSKAKWSKIMLPLPY